MAMNTFMSNKIFLVNFDSLGLFLMFLFFILPETMNFKQKSVTFLLFVWAKEKQGKC